MYASIRTVLLGVSLIFASFGAFAQTPATGRDPNITANGAIGEVKGIDVPSKQIIVKTDAGSLITVSVADSTSYLRLAPGETTLTKATKIAFTDIGEGDRVFARGLPAEDRKSVMSRVVIVMSKGDIARKQEAERAEWRRRGILGQVTALNPATKEITISSRSAGNMQPVIIPVKETVELRRYAPDSIKFSDAKPSRFEELQVGDQLRALGERSTDGAHFTAERVVTGSFRTVAGVVTAVDAATGEVKINELQTKQPLTIVVKNDAILRKFSLTGEMGAMMAGPKPGGPVGGPSVGPGSAAGPGAGQAAVGQAALGQAAANNKPTQPSASATGAAPVVGPGGAPGGPGMAGRPAAFNVQEMLERQPTISIADLKVGDTIVVSSTKGADASRLTAISLLSGADTLLNMMAARQPQAGGASAPNPASAGSGFQLGIGLP
jgi:hypothetical protein